jgi:ureidoacrylate peracid hydrolase
MTQPLSREVEIEPKHTALLFVDVQNYNCLWEGGEYAHSSASEKESRYGEFFCTLKKSALPNMVLLPRACRSAGIEVTYTFIESRTADGRDRSLDYKITGFNAPKGSPDAKIVKELAPGDDEILFPKTSSSVFISPLSGLPMRPIVTPFAERLSSCRVHIPRLIAQGGNVYAAPSRLPQRSNR